MRTRPAGPPMQVPTRPGVRQWRAMEARKLARFAKTGARSPTSPRTSWTSVFPKFRNQGNPRGTFRAAAGVVARTKSEQKKSARNDSRSTVLLHSRLWFSRGVVTTSLSSLSRSSKPSLQRQSPYDLPKSWNHSRPRPHDPSHGG